MIDRLLSAFFAPRNLEPFAILRIGLGVSALLEFLALAPHLNLYFTGAGFFPLQTRATFGPGPGPVYLLAISDSPVWVTFCYICLLGAALAFAAGWKTRVTGPLLWLLQLSFLNRNVYVMAGGITLNIQLLLILMWFDTGGAFATRSQAEGGRIPSWVGYLLNIQMAILYFKSGIYKAMGEAWVNGDALKLMLGNIDWRRFDFDWLLGQDWFLAICQVTTLLTMVWELAFPLLLCHRQGRRLALAVGALIHTAQYLTVTAGPSFPLLVLSVYPCLLSDHDYNLIKGWLKRHLESGKLSVGRLVGRRNL